MSSVNVLQIGEGQTCFVRSCRGSHLFSPRKELFLVASVKVDPFIF